MKKKFAIYAILFVFLLVLGFCLAFDRIALWVNHDPYARERENLAKELGVDINLYPNGTFPENYFYEVLKPGMSSQEVHEIVKGYDAVFHCSNNTEFYYYFSTYGDKASRYLITYDETGKLESTMTEDEDWRSLHFFVHDCIPGLLVE